MGISSREALAGRVRGMSKAQRAVLLELDRRGLRLPTRAEMLKRAKRKQSASGRDENGNFYDWRHYCPHAPTEKQAAFLALEGREALFGGAAGGGKSDALLMAALQYVHIPGYAAIIFRRTYADLSKPGALLERAHAWLDGTAAKWIDETKTWLFPSGAKLAFGYLDSEKDKLNHQGAEYQFVGFDELTQFPEKWYRYLFSRLRRLKGVKIPIRMRGATNPGGIGHNWVMGRFPILTADADAGRQAVGERGRVFIPSKLEDNPFLDTEEYEESLAELDAVTRVQLRRGDWRISAGGSIFKREWFKTFALSDLPANLPMLRQWDLAGTEPGPTNTDPDFTRGLKSAYDSKAKILYILDLKSARKTSGAIKKLIVATAWEDSKRCAVRIEQEGGSSGKYVTEDLTAELIGFDAKGASVSGKGGKLLRARPASAQAEALRILLPEGVAWVSEFLDEVEAFDGQENGGSHDDIVDTLSATVDYWATKRRHTAASW